MLTEEDIIKGCKQYNKAAQMALYKKHAGKMNALCYRYVNSYDDAKDIVQECFVKIFDSIKNYKGEGSFEGWIRRIIVNASIDYLKKKKKHIFVSIEHAEYDPLNTSDHEEKEAYTIENAEFTKEELQDAINQLPEMYRLIFNMHCIENYSHKEIAESLAIKEDTSRSRLRRARIALRDYLHDVMKTKMKFDLSNGMNTL
ncbi:MAG TPA: RNA polymerase sigma factor [Cytophagaceae bacterium]|jgi:RNA polymerase sigma factor (sigma-70 family)|nr:RNA polymerase sigma factor [Cytophagaceae bacterium]